MKHSVLIIDANSSRLVRQKNLLSQVGYDIAIAQDATEASAQLRLTCYSMVIMDLMSPDADPDDGVSLIRQVQTLRPGIPILILTSNTNPAVHRKARSLGVWDISVKPTPTAELLGLTKGILEDAYPVRVHLGK